jgi:hypothetical protein
VDAAAFPDLLGHFPIAVVHRLFTVPLRPERRFPGRTLRGTYLAQATRRRRAMALERTEGHCAQGSVNANPVPRSAQMAGRRASRDPRLRTQWANLLDRLLLLFSTSRRADGLWIGAVEDSSKAGLVLGRVVDALCLIKTHDPHRYCRLLRDLDRVWVRVVPGARGRYNVPLRACELNPRFVLDAASSPELIAGQSCTKPRMPDCGTAALATKKRCGRG